MNRWVGTVSAVILLAAISVQATFPVQRTALWKFYHNKLDCLDRDGIVTAHEFQRFVDQMDPNEDAPGRLPDFRRVSLIHAQYDTNRDGVWDWNEFAGHFGERLLKLDAYDADAPQEIHLSLLAAPGASNSLRVSWAQPTRSATPTVQYGLSPSALNSQSVGTSHNYSVEQSPGLQWTSMWLNEVVITNLKPSTVYYYRCGGPDVEWSNITRFVSPPAADASSCANPSVAHAPVTWAVYGDMGTVVPLGYQVTEQLVAANQVTPFQMILHVGDLAYAGVSNGKNGEWEPTWDVWMNQIQPLSESIPYQISIGNHESYYNYTAATNRFDMQSSTSGENGNGNFWWSMDYGCSVHLTSVSTENDYSVGSVQYNWIEADLAAARARNVRWLFVGGHRPFLSSDESEYSSHQPGAPMLSSLGPLFDRYGVDVVFTGHMHMYERMYPVFANGSLPDGITPGQTSFVNPAAPIYIVQGNAGAMILESLVNPQPDWSAIRKQEYGFGVLNLSVDQTSGQNKLMYISMSNGVVIDQFEVLKS